MWWELYFILCEHYTCLSVLPSQVGMLRSRYISLTSLAFFAWRKSDFISAPSTTGLWNARKWVALKYVGKMKGYKLLRIIIIWMALQVLYLLYPQIQWLRRVIQLNLVTLCKNGRAVTQTTLHGTSESALLLLQIVLLFSKVTFI